MADQKCSTRGKISSNNGLMSIPRCQLATLRVELFLLLKMLHKKMANQYTWKIVGIHPKSPDNKNDVALLWLVSENKKDCSWVARMAGKSDSGHIRISTKMKFCMPGERHRLKRNRQSHLLWTSNTAFVRRLVEKGTISTIITAKIYYISNEPSFWASAYWIVIKITRRKQTKSLAENNRNSD